MKHDRSPYVTVSSGIGGHYAVLMHWHDEGFYEPWNTGSKFADIDSAIIDAKQWAEAECLEYRV